MTKIRYVLSIRGPASVMVSGAHPIRRRVEGRLRPASRKAGAGLYGPTVTICIMASVMTSR